MAPKNKPKKIEVATTSKKIDYLAFQNLILMKSVASLAEAFAMLSAKFDAICQAQGFNITMTKIPFNPCGNSDIPIDIRDMISNMFKQGPGGNVATHVPSSKDMVPADGDLLKLPKVCKDCEKSFDCYMDANIFKGICPKNRKLV